MNTLIHLIGALVGAALVLFLVGCNGGASLPSAPVHSSSPASVVGPIAL